MAEALRDGEKASIRFGIGDANKDGKVDVSADITLDVPLLGKHTLSIPPVNVPVDEVASGLAPLLHGVAGFSAGLGGLLHLPALPGLPKL